MPVSISFSLIDWNSLHLRSRYSRLAWKSWDFVSSVIWCSSDSSDDEDEDPDSDEELELDEDDDEPDEEVDDVLKLCMATMKEELKLIKAQINESNLQRVHCRVACW